MSVLQTFNDFFENGNGDKIRAMGMAGPFIPYESLILIRTMAGQLKDKELHSICWKHFLGLIPNDKPPSEWAAAVKEKRTKYDALKDEYILDPTKVLMRR